MASIVNTFKKLDTDTSVNKQERTSFYDAQNLRLINDEALSSGALVNYKGTKAKINLGGPGIKLKGYAEVGDELALLIYNDTESLEPDGPPSDIIVSEGDALGFTATSEPDVDGISNFINVNTPSYETAIDGATPLAINIGVPITYIGVDASTNVLQLAESLDGTDIVYHSINIDFSSALTSAVTIIVAKDAISSGNGIGLIRASKVHDIWQLNPGSTGTSRTVSGISGLGYSVIIYPGTFSLVGSNYEISPESLTVNISDVEILYLLDGEMSYININDSSEYKSSLTPNISSITSSYSIDFDVNDLTVIEDITDFIGGGLTLSGGHNYILHILTELSAGTDVANIYLKESISGNIVDWYQLTDGTHDINIDLRLMSGEHKLVAHVGVGEGLIATINSLNRINYLVEFYDINISSNVVIGLNVRNSSPSPVTSSKIFVHNGSTTIKQITVPVYASSDSPDTLSYIAIPAGYDGYKLMINTSPDILIENTVDVINLKIHVPLNSDNEIYDSFTAGKYYTISTTVNEYGTYPAIGGIDFKVINTTTGSNYYVRNLQLGTTEDIKFIIPDDGNTYKMYLNAYYDDLTANGFSVSPMLITEYTLDGQATVGSKIARVSVSDGDDIQNIQIVYSDYASIDKLGFNEVDEVEVIGRYENEFSKKVYFSIPGKPLRLFNIVQDSMVIDEVSTLDILPNNSGSIITVDRIVHGGSLEAGKIQYSCRLFNKYSTETTFSPCSELIALTSSTPNDSSEFTGSDIEENSGKAVNISIDLSNISGFDYIHIYSIHYKTKSTPVISLIGELPINGTSVDFLDTGAILDTITVEEFNSFGGRLFSSETLAVKNNILFAANIKELESTISESDIDCRAYRFDSATQSKVYEANGDYYLIESDGSWEKFTSLDVSIDSGSDWDIPVDADCINKYNDEFLIANGESTHDDDGYMYQLDGTTIGGSGKVVSYEIKLDTAFNDSNKLVSGGETIVTSDNINHILKSTSFKQGETYRLGITFYDLKGRPYFNRWIGDVRIPYMDTIKSQYSYTGSGTTDNDLNMWMKNISIEFTVNTLSIASDIKSNISGFQITKVERTELDKSVVAQGYTMGGITYDVLNKFYMHRCLPVKFGETIHSSMSAQSALYPYVTNFISPEFNVNGGIDVDGAYRFKIVKILSSPMVKLRKETAWNDIYTLATYKLGYAATRLFYPITESYNGTTVTNRLISSMPGTTITAITPGVSIDIVTIRKFGLSELNSSSSVLSANGTDIKFTNRVASDVANSEATGSGGTHSMYSPTSIVASLTEALDFNADFNSGSIVGYVYLLDMYNNNASTRYGGNTYQARANNQYHSISEFTEISSPSIIAYGDIYNTIFDTLTSIPDPNADDQTPDDTVYSESPGDSLDRRQIVGLFPIESSVNCALLNNKPSKYVFNYPSGRDIESKYVGLTETTAQGIGLYGSKYPSVDDFNKYNTAYSAINTYPILTPEPVLFDDNKVSPNLIIASEKKTNGEFVDSWGKFLYANLIEVDGEYGAIHKLTALDNKLYYFQENAIGVAAVNDRYLLSEGAAQLALGTGGVLERYDYVKYNSGIIKPFHVFNTTNGLYYIDHNRKVIDVVRESPLSLSVEKGVNALFRSLYRNSNTKIRIGYDPVYREVLFSITNDLIGKTLVFSEYMNEFGPRTSILPELFVSLSNGLYSYVPSNQEFTDNPNYIFKHNSGDFGEVYSEAGYDISDKNYEQSTVSVIVNSGSTNIMVFDNVEFRTEVRDYDTNNDFDLNSAFNDIEDNLKTVSEIDFKNSYQSVDKLISVKGVDSNPNTSRLLRSWTTAVPLTSTGKRFVDSFIMLTFKFTNRDNKLFKIHDITTHVRGAHK